MHRRPALVLLLLASAAAPNGCSGTPSAPAPAYASRQALLDPKTCGSCHVQHYADWSVSMHAYASDDPVFVAMNKRGQRETGGALGDFCVKCHAPMAVHEGATKDGLNLDSLPQALKGVTCFFCHTVESVQGTHDDPLVLANDVTMRGEITDPVVSPAHPTAYSPLQDREQLGSAPLCGACHDIVSPHGAAIERTFVEWKASIFSHTLGGDTCAECHMQQSARMAPIADVAGAPPRYYHAHDFPGVDRPLTSSFPSTAPEQRAQQAFLETSLQSALCVVTGDGPGAIRVILDNVAAGHAFPSGSAQDRRLWAEVIARRGGEVIYQSGVVPAGAAPTSLTSDPDFWLIRDCMFDAKGAEVRMFWQAASVESNLLPYPTTIDPTSPAYYRTHVVQYFPRDPLAVLPAPPDEVTLRLRLQSIGLDVIEDLVRSGDLDPGVAAAVPTYDVEPERVLTWTAASANASYVENGLHVVKCVTRTNLNVQAEAQPAVNHVRCKP